MFYEPDPARGTYAIELYCGADDREYDLSELQ